MKCEAKQFSDKMVCVRCGISWDMNDPHTPGCTQRQDPGKAQTRLESFVEVCVNIFLGWLVSMTITLWIVVPIWNLDWTTADSFWVTVIYTVAAIMRGYIVRRFFNAQLHKSAVMIARVFR